MNENRIKFGGQEIDEKNIVSIQVNRTNEVNRLIEAAAQLSTKVSELGVYFGNDDLIRQLDQALIEITGSSDWNGVIDFVAKNCGGKS